MGWTFVWLMVALKIPIGALLYIVWWAIHQTDDAPAGGGDGGTPTRHRTRAPRHPRRRGPHGAPAMAAPRPRMRHTVVARARSAPHH